MSGHLSLVSVGPGELGLVPQRAREALQRAEVVVAYDLYLTWVRPLLSTQELLTPPLTREKERAELAIARASAGQRVAIVSSGDIGVYAMAGLVFEELAQQFAQAGPTFEVEVIPGITSATACASLLGSPLTHDFATLSLSDLLCPWDWIAHRASHIAQADLACVLYNVQSKARQDGVYQVLRLMLQHKRPDTVCGVVRNAYRQGQEVRITTLEALQSQQFDMLTTIIIGNRFTVQCGRWMYTPRGYNDWPLPKSAPALSSDPTLSPAPAPTPALLAEVAPPVGATWVYSGTHDGNALALALAEAGQEVVLSAASDLGRALAPQHPRLHLHSGPAGQEARRRALAGARAVVDATHPYAQHITAQLEPLCAELKVPYLRYQRPSALPSQMQGVQLFASAAAAALAAGQYRRVFLATGSNDLDTFTRLAPQTQWCVRLTPQPQLIERALALGIAPQRLCAMVGPFSREFNAAQWRAWDVQAVITKDSGEVGGFTAKLEAARDLGLPLLVIERPAATAQALQSAAQVIAALQDLPPARV